MKRFLALLFLGFFLVGCNYLPRKKNDYFNEKDNEVLATTTQPMAMDYGFDSQIDLNYIYYIKKGEGKSADVYAALDKLTPEELDAYYSKIYTLFEMTQYLHHLYYKDQKWTFYNYLEKELKPAVTDYLALVEGYMKKKSTLSNEAFEAKKSELRTAAILHIQDKRTVVDEY